MPIDTSAADLHSRLVHSEQTCDAMLDVGCGRGAHLAGTSGAIAMRDLRARGGSVIGIDVAVPDEGNPHVTEFRAIGLDGHWPLDDASVDVAFCDWVLEHVVDPELFFAECGRVLRPGGLFIARTMQTWGIAGIGARILPRRYHTPVIQRLQPGMHSEDVFPTALRCNTLSALRRLFAANRMQLQDVETHATLAGYGAGRPRLERGLELLERALPSGMRHAIVMTAVRIDR